MTKFILSMAMVIIAFAVGVIVFSMTKNLDWAMLTTAVVFVGYVVFAVYQSKRAKTLKVK